MNPVPKKFVVIAVLGILAPLWWTWVISHLTLAIYVANGSPDRPTTALIWTSIYLPSLVLGALAGALLAKLSDVNPMTGWLIFIVSLVVASAILGFVFSSPIEYVLSIFNTVENGLFIIGTMIMPGAMCVRSRHV